jgi:hypothetical protein
VSSSPRRSFAFALAAAVVLAALVGVGRWERSRNARDQVRGMERVRALVAPLDSRSLSGYRVQPAFDCLVYRSGRNPFALELCFDRAGRLVEAIDRRTQTRHISSLRSDPSASSVRVDRREIDRLLRKMGATARAAP